MRVWKTVPTGPRSSAPGMGLYVPGGTVVAANPDGPPNAHSSWLWGCESLELAIRRGHAYHSGEGCGFDVYELEVDEREVEGFPWSGGRGYLRFKRCRVIARRTVRGPS